MGVNGKRVGSAGRMVMVVNRCVHMAGEDLFVVIVTELEWVGTVFASTANFGGDAEIVVVAVYVSTTESHTHASSVPGQGPVRMGAYAHHVACAKQHAANKCCGCH